MMMFGYLLASGITTGALYALVALGITVVYKATRSVNFAHGDLFMIGGFIAYTFHVMWGLPYVVALLLAVAAGFAIGAVVERLAFRPLRDQGLVSLLLAAIGLSFILKGTARAVWGGKGDFIPFPPIATPSPISVGGILVVPQQLIVLAGAIAVMAIFAGFFKFTKLGRMMQATADNAKAAKLVGIPVNRTIAVAFALGAVLSGIAGLLVAPIFLAEPTMGGSLGLKGFVVSVIGGFGNLPGAVIGGMCLGLIETFGARYISSDFRDAYAFIVMIGFLIAWPRGLFGEKASEKV